MATFTQRMAPPISPSTGAYSLGEALGNALGGPTPLQKLQIDKFKLGMEEMQRRGQLIDAQTGLTNAKTEAERLGIRGKNMAAPAFGDMAADNVAPPAIVEAPVKPGGFGNYGPQPGVMNMTPAEYERKKRLAHDAAMGNALSATGANDMASGAGKVNGMVGIVNGVNDPDFQRKMVTLYTGKAPDRNDVLGSYDTVGLNQAIQLEQAKEAAKPPHSLTLNGGVVIQNPDGTYRGDPTFAPNPIGGDNKGLMDREIMALQDKQRNTPDQFTRDDAAHLAYLEKERNASSGRQPTEAQTKADVILTTNAAVNKAIASGDTSGLNDPELLTKYSFYYNQTNPDEQKEINGRLGQFPGTKLGGNIITPDQLASLLQQIKSRGDTGPAIVPAPGEQPQAPGPLTLAPPKGEVKWLTDPKPITPTDWQSKDNGYLSTAKVAEQNVLSKLNQNNIPGTVDTALTNIDTRNPVAGFMRNFTDENAKLYATGGLAFVSAILRKDSGAAITDVEFANYWNTYIPLATDGPKVISLKQQLRDQRMADLAGGLTEDQLRQQAALDSKLMAQAKGGAGGGAPAPAPGGLPKLEIGQSHNAGNGVIITREAD